jgi:hypothetical protein
MLENVSDKELVLRTNASKIIPVMLIVFVVGLVIVSVIVGRAGGGLGAASTFWMGLICLIILLVALCIPVREVFSFHKEVDSFLHLRSYLASNLGFPKSIRKKYEFSKTTVEKSTYRNIHTWKITTDQKAYILNMENVYQHREPSESPLMKVDKFYFGDTPEISEALEISDVEIEEISKNFSQESEAASKKFHMQKEIRSWGWSFLILGGVHFISFGLLAPSWGVILLLVGIASFQIIDPAMFVVYGISLAWVGLNNVISSNFGFWTFFGLFQIYIAYQVYKKYNIYKGQPHIEELAQDEESFQEQNIASRYFPNVGCWLSAVSLIVFIGIFMFMVFIVVFSAVQNQEATIDNDQILTFVLDVSIGLGVIGFAVSLAALLSKFKPAWKAWIGIVCSLLLMVMNFALLLM